MKRGLSILMCTLLFMGVCAGCAGEKKVSGAADASVPEQKEDTVPAGNPDWPDGTSEDLSQYDAAKFGPADYIVPVWDDGGIARSETVFILQEKDGSIAPISLLYPAKQIVSVYSYGLDIRYEEGRDYSLTKDGKLQVAADGAIPAIAHEAFYLPVYDPSNPANMPEIYGTGAQLYTEAIKEGETRSLCMTRWQVRVTYRHSARWNGGVPANQSADLKRTNGILNDTDKAGTLKIACLGDSITQGWTASGYENVDIAPHMPPYVELFKTGLQNRYKKAKIELRNFSIAGKTTRWPLFEEDGIVNFQSLLAYKPDLVLVAFGMNDGTGIEPKDFSDNIEAIVKQILAARSDTEIVLVSSMLPNQEIRTNWGDGAPICRYQPSFKSVLERIAAEFRDQGKAVVHADVQSVFQHLLQTKRFQDITSNNTNHPNDYMQRVYAQVLLQTVAGF